MKNTMKTVFNSFLLAVIILAAGYSMSFSGLYQYLDDNFGLPLNEWVVTHVK